MITQDTFEDLLERTAMAALMYDPELATTDGAVSLSEHTRFVLAEADIPEEHITKITDLVTATIVDPTSHRFVLYSYLLQLMENEEPQVSG